MAQEEFRPNLDHACIRRAQREVLLGVSDGHPDLLQQVEYGAESLLASYRVAGYIFPGVIENNELQCGTSGDPVNTTDNLIYDPRLKPGQIQGDRSGTFDDRWVFINHNTGLQYECAQALAIASRVMRPDRPKLAREALAAVSLGGTALQLRRRNVSKVRAT